MIVLYFILFVVVFCILHYLFPVIKVIGDSMYPTYLNDDIIFGSKIYRKSKLKKGDVILYQCPTDPERIVIKRIDSIMVRNGVRYFYCLGDNVNNSHDSRDYGFVHSKHLVCKVINQRRNIYYECIEERWND